jgi:hypothetical protein
MISALTCGNENAHHAAGNGNAKPKNEETWK